MTTLATPTTQTVYVVQECHWMYDDSLFYPTEPEGKEPLKAFRDRRRAEAYRNKLVPDYFVTQMELEWVEPIEDLTGMPEKKFVTGKKCLSGFSKSLN